MTVNRKELLEAEEWEKRYQELAKDIVLPTWEWKVVEQKELDKSLRPDEKIAMGAVFGIVLALVIGMFVFKPKPFDEPTIQRALVSTDMTFLIPVDYAPYSVDKTDLIKKNDDVKKIKSPALQSYVIGKIDECKKLTAPRASARLTMKNGDIQCHIDGQPPINLNSTPSVALAVKK